MTRIIFRGINAKSSSCVQGKQLGMEEKKLKLLKLVIPLDGLPKVFAFEVDEKFVFGVCAPSLETTLQVLI